MKIAKNVFLLILPTLVGYFLAYIALVVYHPIIFIITIFIIYLASILYIVLFFKHTLGSPVILPCSFAFTVIPICIWSYMHPSSVDFFGSFQYLVAAIIGIFYVLPFTVITVIIKIIAVRKKWNAIPRE